MRGITNDDFAFLSQQDIVIPVNQNLEDASNIQTEVELSESQIK